MMRFNKRYYLLILYIVISLACNTLTNLPLGGPSQDKATKVPPPLAHGNGPQAFSAIASSSDSVKLSWQTVEGATSYHVAVSTNGGEILTAIDLAPSVTSYEDLLAAPNSQLTYAVEALGNSGSIGQSVASVTTPPRKPNALQVLAQFNPQASVSQKIGPAGGSLKVKDKSGVSYELSIPANALDTEVEVSLIPVAELSNWPLDGKMLGAIGMQPEGLTFNEPAYLTITYPSKIASDGLSTVGFTFQGYGQEFSLQTISAADTASTSFWDGTVHLASPVEQQVPPRVIRLPVMDLTPKGAGRLSHELAKELIRQNLPLDSAAAMDQKQAAALATEEDELAPLPDFSWMRNFEAFHRQIDDVSNCRELKKAIVSLANARREADGAATGNGKSRTEQEDKSWTELVDKTKEVIDGAAQECTQKKSGEQKFTNAPCAAGVLRSIAAGGTPFYKEFQKRMLDAYGKDAIIDGQTKINNAGCKAGYLATGASNGVNFTDQICGIEEPFSITGFFPGGSATTTFTPSSPIAGTNVMSGGGGGCGQSGGGTYMLAISPDDGSGILNWTDKAGVDCPGTGKNNAFTVTLHKIENVCAK
jgi:hypothetical protein